MYSKFLFAGLMLTLSTFTVSASIEDCVGPKAPEIPDGSSSTEDEMVAGVGVFKSYQADVAVYRECLEQFMVQPEGEVTKDAADLYKRAVELHNESVDEEKKAGAELNSQIRSFKNKAK